MSGMQKNKRLERMMERFYEDDVLRHLTPPIWIDCFMGRCFYQDIAPAIRTRSITDNNDFILEVDKRLKQLLDSGVELQGGAMLDTYNQAVHSDTSCTIRTNINTANHHFVVEEPFNTAEGGISRTIKAQYYKNGMANFVRKDGLGATCVVSKTEDMGESKTICLNSKVNGKQPSIQDRIYDIDGCSTAITTCFLPNIAEPQIGAMRGRNPNNPSERGKSEGNYKQRLEMNEQGVSNTLTSVYKDNVVVEPKVQQVGNIYPDTEGFKNRTMGRVYSGEGLSPTINCCGGGDREPKIVDSPLKVPQATAQGYAECEVGGAFDGSYPNSTTRRGRVQEGGKISPALTSGDEPLNRWEGGYRIRKLTPRECFRLMGVSESDIDKIQNYVDPDTGKPISNSQQYKMAGNSIVVDNIYHIFRTMFVETKNPDLQMTIFDML